MIVELAEAACRQIDEVDGLEIARKEATDVCWTVKELTNVKEKLAQLVEFSSLLGTRLSLKELREVDIPKILQELQVLHKKFIHERERRQVQPLNLISTRLQNM